MSRPALVAPDSFKGTFPANQVAAAVAAGLRMGGRDAVELPVADGGEGTTATMLRALGGELREAEVSDPLGRPVTAEYGLLADGGPPSWSARPPAGAGSWPRRSATRSGRPRAVRAS